MKKSSQKLFVAALILCFCIETWAQSLIPNPSFICLKQGDFCYAEGFTLRSNIKGPEGKFLKAFVLETFGNEKSNDRTIVLTCKAEKNLSRKDLESYKITSREKSIHITAAAPAGIFYALQTLRQIADGQNIACCDIEDSPRFAYRGLMIDCSRHFWSPEVIKKQIDAMALFKLNTLHLHLTDAGGWRMEIKRYPQLTELAAYRTQSDWNLWWNQCDRRYALASSPGAYGGFYTQKELRDIVAYASLRNINIVPEIEMPGHSEEAIHACPWLSCEEGSGGEMCIGKETTFEFIENVLDEVMDVFPSRYIHIGGDEAAHSAWEKCGLCQKRMADEALSTYPGLQAYMTARVGRYLEQKGRILVGWDEITEGPMSEGAVVMSWRGEEGGVLAARAGHDVIMSPGSYCYFDHYQDAPHTQPYAQSSYVPLERVYSYEPLGEKLLGTGAEVHVLGISACLWTEYIPTPQHLEYMLYPRLLAIAENGWSSSKTSFVDFRSRALIWQDKLQSSGYNTFDLRKETGKRKEARKPLTHKALGKKVKYLSPISHKYTGGGERALTDGLKGDWNFADGHWQAFLWPDSLDVVIDMEEPADIRSVEADFMQSEGAYIFLPSRVCISVSNDGKTFSPLKSQEQALNRDLEYTIKPLGWQGKARARYIRYQAFPAEKSGWIFLDEIIVK